MIRDGADEARSPKYAHVERERRWLIDPALHPAISSSHVLIEDLYIVGTRLRLRRMTEAATGRISRKLTKKYETPDLRARAIVTAYLDEAEYDVLAALPGMSLAKHRHPLSSDALIFSLDRFLGPLEGLELAEIEWPDDAGLRGLPPPPGAVREVSDDIRYQGGSLVAHGVPKEDRWPIS